MQTPEAHADDLADFWEEAKPHAKLNIASSYLGTNSIEAVPPSSFSFGSTPEVADELLRLVVAGIKTATSSDARWYGEGVPEPAVGKMEIVTDGHGFPVALIVTTSVTRCAFDEVTAEHARAEGEGDRTLEYWQSAHRDYFAQYSPPGAEFSPGMELLLEEFKVLYAREPRS